MPDSPITWDEATTSKVSVFFDLASKPTRLKILAGLAHGQLNVSTLVDRIGAAQPNVSGHLRMLRMAGAIEPERQGQNVSYGLTETGRALLEAAERIARLPG